MIRVKRYRNPLLAIAAILVVVLVFAVPDATTETVAPDGGVDLLSDKEYDPYSLPALRKTVEVASQQYRGTSDLTASEQRVIYGADNRLDIYAVTDPNILKLADAACLVVSTGELSDNGNGTYSLSTAAWVTQSGATICSDERFRGQLTAGYCSGYLVGEDILVTAGHCANSGTCGSTAFVFGFMQIDSLTPPLVTISADDVYFCDAIIDQRYSGDEDHCVLRLDRPVVGHDPLPIRRTGSVSNGDSLIVVGHPVGLPMKAAGGAIVQNANGATEWFQANLDTYGGNSGSLVANLTDFMIEGILVRGAPDFINDGGCTRSNTVPNSGNTGGGLQFEEVSKTTHFASFIPDLISSAGTCELDRADYRCTDVLSIEVEDADLIGSGTQDVSLISSNGDTEAITLAESPANSGRFSTTVTVTDDAVITEDGVLQVLNAAVVTVTYNDADDGTGFPAVVTDDATVDCVAPAITNVAVTNIQGAQVTVTFETNETATPVVRYGLSCGLLTQSGAGLPMTQFQSVTVTGLIPNTTYYFQGEATDLGGNSTTDDNGGICYTFTTADVGDYFTEEFSTAELDNDVDFQTLTLTPDGLQDFYDACRVDAASLPTDQTGGTTLSLGDDASIQVTLAGGEMVYLYGTGYGSFFVGSNGYITFGAGDSDYTESLAEHFGPEPRISGLFDDLNPAQGGAISWKQLADRVAVTWLGVTEYDGANQNTFQIEMFFDGVITITHLAIAAADGIVGIGEGLGTPGDFVESNLTGYPECAVGCPDADSDGVCDPDDNCPNIPNAGQENDDTDSLGNACDNCPTVDNSGQENDDTDSLGNACDNCIAIDNNDQANSDSDEIGDACDNCLTYPNPAQEGCPNHGDIAGDDGIFDSQDLNGLIDQLFFGAEMTVDTGCPHVSRSDVDCDGFTDALDLNYFIDVIYFGGAPPCNPCACDPYPANCP